MIGKVCEPWESSAGCSDWCPALLHCGTYDHWLRAFPVMANGDTHFLWIPQECKFALRFLDHAICLWWVSLNSWIPLSIHGHLSRTGKYADQLWSKFFDDVLKYWYKPVLVSQHRRNLPLKANHFDHYISMPSWWWCSTGAPQSPPKISVWLALGAGDQILQLMVCVNSPNVVLNGFSTSP